MIHEWLNVTQHGATTNKPEPGGQECYASEAEPAMEREDRS
jgi:hypothetical protein